MAEEYKLYVGVIPDADGSTGYGLEILSMSPAAQRTREVMMQRYRDHQKWSREHPTLDWIGRNVLSPVANFVNDDVMMNRGNVRVNNAQANPDAMNAVQSGGNLAAGMLAAGIGSVPLAATAPTWAPWLLGTPAGALAASGTTTALATSKEWIPWLIGATGAYGTTRMIMDNGVPSFSYPDYKFPGIMESRKKKGNGNQGAPSLPLNPAANPTPTQPATPTLPTQPANPLGPTLAPGLETLGTTLGVTPKLGLRQRFGNWISGNKPQTATGGATPEPPKRSNNVLKPFSGYSKGSSLGNLLRFSRDYLYTTEGVPLFGEALYSISSRTPLLHKNIWQWLNLVPTTSSTAPTDPTTNTQTKVVSTDSVESRALTPEERALYLGVDPATIPLQETTLKYTPQQSTGTINIDY